MALELMKPYFLKKRWGFFNDFFLLLIIMVKKDKK